MTMTTIPARILKTPGVCGGAARIGNQRLPVWSLVLASRLGESDASLLANYPNLTQDDLDACWTYYQHNANEIEQHIWLNDTAANIPDGVIPPASVIIAGRLLGLSDAEVMAAFEPALTMADISAAWSAYRTDPLRLREEMARTQVVG